MKKTLCMLLCAALLMTLLLSGCGKEKAKDPVDLLCGAGAKAVTVDSGKMTLGLELNVDLTQGDQSTSMDFKLDGTIQAASLQSGSPVAAASLDVELPALLTMATGLDKNMTLAAYVQDGVIYVDLGGTKEKVALSEDDLTQLQDLFRQSSSTNEEEQRKFAETLVNEIAEDSKVKVLKGSKQELTLQLSGDKLLEKLKQAISSGDVALPEELNADTILNALTQYAITLEQPTLVMTFAKDGSLSSLQMDVKASADVEGMQIAVAFTLHYALADVNGTTVTLPDDLASYPDADLAA